MDHQDFGKTTLSNIISNEMNSNIKITSGPAIEKPGDLAALLTNLSEFDVLFIDEIHRLSKSVEEILYPALEDYTLDIIIGKGPSARSIRLDLPKFTLIGATTKAGSLTTPLRDRFGIVHRLELYSTEDLTKIVKRSSKILEVNIEEEAAKEIARRSRGTPRIANRLLKRVRDYALVLGDGNITLKITKHALNKLEIDELGLDEIDRKLLETMIVQYNRKTSRNRSPSRNSRRRNRHNRRRIRTIFNTNRIYSKNTKRKTSITPSIQTPRIRNVQLGTFPNWTFCPIGKRPRLDKMSNLGHIYFLKGEWYEIIVTYMLCTM